ncbi:MAG TPA: undecaprenyl-phosphate glucose phosphotransferase [Burkholderiales bacterium]|nr:undecaprenyl-phosphate glucose phosphotransferase [Burkholderiales bacterium]
MNQLVTPVMFRKAGRIAIGRDRLLNVIEMTLEPLLLVISLWVVAQLLSDQIGARHIILAVLVFSLTFPGAARLSQSLWRAIRNIAIGWVALAVLLVLFGYVSRYLDYFDSQLLTTWFWAAPACAIGGHIVLRLSAPAIHQLQGGIKHAIIAGMNEQGVELARRLGSDMYSNVHVTGFFEDRARERVKHTDEFPVLGKIADLSQYAKKNHVDVIYLSLPMASQQRIVALLDELRDTTASIYFVPDIFVTDLIQGRMDSVSGIPVVGVCDTPFSGLSGVIKRGSDIVLSLVILLLLAPFLLLLALAVKLSSPGPAIFRQRRYGLDGSEIIVYKFRTMSVLENGNEIKQATKGDSRVTPLGAFMRKTSLDELPQFINVLQGRMSIVGPRPHAVAHNEMYRKLVKGYMQRHKVKPGITGWAQVNGLRGETETVDKMKARIDFDLDYLRNWSLRLDLYIILKTVWVVFKGANAY